MRSPWGGNRLRLDRLKFVGPTAAPAGSVQAECTRARCQKLREASDSPSGESAAWRLRPGRSARQPPRWRRCGGCWLRCIWGRGRPEAYSSSGGAGALGCALTPAAERAALVRRRGASGMVQAPSWCYESRSAWSDAEAVLEQPLSSPGAARAPPPDITLHRQRRPFAVSGHTVLPLRNKHRDYERCGKLVYETCQHRHSCCVQKSRQVCTRTVTTEERISLAAAAAVGESAVPHLITAGPQGGRRGDGCDEHTRLTLW